MICLTNFHIILHFLTIVDCILGISHLFEETLSPMKSQRYYAPKMFAAFFLVLFVSTLSLAQEPLPLPPAPDGSQAEVGPTFGSVTDVLAYTQGTNDINQLANLARSSGQVRVIVGLAVADGEGLSDAVRAQNIAMAQAEVLNALRGMAYTVNSQYDFIPYMALTVDEAALAALASNRMVTSIELDAINAPLLNNTTTIIGANGAGGAWKMGYRGLGYTVAVLDTGVAKNHVALSGRVVSEACYGSYSSGSNYVAKPWCPGGAQASTAVNSGLNCPVSYVGCDHGTHVAGIVGSKHATYTGVAPQVNIIAIQVFSRFDGALCTGFYGSPKCTLTFTSDVIDGLNRVYALRNLYNIAAVNLSLGGGKYTSQASCDSANAAYKAAFDKLRNVGIASIVASGNDGHTDGLGSPACISSVISVGATSDTDLVAAFSNAALFLDLLAPGVSVHAPVPGAPTNAKFTSMSGTSMAAPHVAGAWALMKQAVPEASVSEIEQSFKATGKPIADIGTTFPRINVDDAIKHLLQFNANSNYVMNRSFESNLQRWTLANKTSGDKVIVQNGAPNGRKVFRFSGPRSVWTTLTQNVMLNPAYNALGSLGAGDTVTLSVCYKANIPSTNPKPVLRLRVVFSGGAVETKVVNLERNTGSAFKCDKSVTHTIVGLGTISAIEAIVGFRAPSGGTLLIDKVSLK